MNDTQQSPPPGGQAPPGLDDDFDPQRLRSITDMRRSDDDRLVAGVCSGAARYLNIDPVIVRVVIAVLTIAGFAGVIVYVAAWLLIPAEHEDRSLVAEWFNLDDNEEQVRTVGLVVAVILAGLSIVGNSSWAWWGDTPWWILPFALVAYVFWVRPRRRREARRTRDRRERPVVPDPATVSAHEYATAKAAAITDKKLTKARTRRSPALLALTVSLTAIALAALWIYEETHEGVPWTAYVAVALAVVGAGLLISTFVGDGGLLIGIGVLLAITLAIGSVFPSGRIGSQRPTPTVAAQVEPHYRHGIGQFELDLTGVTDPVALEGRTIRIDAGIGQTRVIVPDGLKVAVDSDLKAGEISLFGRTDDGTDVSMSAMADPPDGTALTIDIDQKLGQIEVISR